MDDDAGLCNLVSLQLQGQGYNVLTARNGEEALCLLEEQPKGQPKLIDLMITDYEMPDMSGIELVQRAHAASPNLKIVLMSGRPRENIPATQVPFCFLQKVFNTKQLLDAVASAIGQ